MPCIALVYGPFHLPAAPPPPYSTRTPVIYDDIPLPPFPVIADAGIVSCPFPNGGGAAPPAAPAVPSSLVTLLPPFPEIPVPIAPAKESLPAPAPPPPCDVVDIKVIGCRNVVVGIADGALELFHPPL